MRRYTYVFSIIVAMLLGCDAGDDVTKVKSPVVSIKVGSEVPVTVLPGTDLDFVFSLQYKGGISSAYAMVDGEIIPGSERTFSNTPESVTLEFSYKVSDASTGNTLDFAVHAEGADGAKGHYDYPVFILAAKPDITIMIPEDAPNEFLVNGSALSFDILIRSSSVDMKQVTTYKGEIEIPEMSFPVEGDLRNVVLPFRYTPALGETGSTTTFTVEVMDVNGNIVNERYSVKFFKEAPTEIKEYSGITLGLNRCTSHGQFLDLLTNTVYSAPGVGAVCAEIDLCVFWSANSGTQGLAFAAPAFTSLTLVYTEATVVGILGGSADDILANWTTRNHTTFREVDLDADTYAAVSTREELVEFYQNGTVPSKEDAVYRKVVGSTISFKISRTAASSAGEVEKYGLLRVTARPATNNTGIITIDYKIEN